MASQEDDISQVIQYTNNWALSSRVTEKQIQNPTQSFVHEFFCNFINLLDEKLAYIVGKSSLLGNWDQRSTQAYASEVDYNAILFYQLQYCLSKIITYFNLGDLYQPSGKRTRTSIVYATNYLIYLDSISEDIVNVAKERNEKAEQYEKYNREIEELKFSMSKLVEECVYVEDSLQSLKNKEGEVNQLHKKQEDEKENDQQMFKNLRKQYEDLVEADKSYENHIKQQQEQIRTLEDKTVDGSSVNAILQEEENITAKLNGLDIQEEENNTIFKYKPEELQHLEKVESNLRALNLDFLGNLIRNTHEEVVGNKKIHAQKVNEMKSLDKQCQEFDENIQSSEYARGSFKTNKLPRIVDLKEEIDETKFQTLTLISSQETTSKQHSFLLKEHIDQQSECNDLERDIEYVNAFHAEAYKKYFNCYNAVTDELQRFSDIC